MTREQISPPAIGKSSFNCPHCQALAQQFWMDVIYRTRRDGPPTPIPGTSTTDPEGSLPEGLPRALVGLFLDRNSPNPHRVPAEKSGVIGNGTIANMFLSQCLSCKQASVWLRDRLLYPNNIYPILANDDLPGDIRADFDEARAIVAISPRGAAALLRLAVQKLCHHLGKGGDINSMIGQLVADGLSERVHQALDVVRVVGNESVHPGVLDLRDTPETAEQLFLLVNVIAERTITEPKHVDEMFMKLPPEKRAAIAARNERALGRQPQPEAPAVPRPDE